MSKMKRWQKVVAVFLVIVLFLGIVALYLLCPRTTAKEVDNWLGEESFDIQSIKTIDKTKDDFTILAITDIQFDNPFYSKKDVKTAIKNMIDKTNPDLIVTGGDNFAGIFNHFHVKAFTKMMDEFGVPWAPIFGNHEYDFHSDLYYLSKQMMKSENIIFDVGPTNIDGVGNYLINIMDGDSIFYSLVLMDSNAEVFRYDGRGNRLYSYYDGIRPSQIEWYEDNINGLAKSEGRTVDTILFSHTALPQFNDAYYAIKNNTPFDGVSVKYNYGNMVEELGGCRYEYGMYEKMAELGSTKYHFFGHDHSNNTSLNYNGIDMTYIQNTGHNKGDQIGGTLIKIDSDKNVSHEIIMGNSL